MHSLIICKVICNRKENLFQIPGFGHVIGKNIASTASRLQRNSFVNSFDQITSLLKLYREKERRRHVNALDLNALSIGATGSDLVSPERQPARVRLPTKEIEIVQLSKESGLIDRVRAGRGFIVKDCYCRRAR